MPLQISVTVQNAILDAVETAIGASAILRIRSGAVPANVAAADAGTVLATLNLPADWMSAASANSKALLGSWTDSSADATGTAGHWRIYTSGGTAMMQGNITLTGGGGDMTLDSLSITAAQAVTVTAFTLAAANS